jgi:hypothetical protein
VELCNKRHFKMELEPQNIAAPLVDLWSLDAIFASAPSAAFACFVTVLIKNNNMMCSRLPPARRPSDLRREKARSLHAFACSAAVVFQISLTAPSYSTHTLYAEGSSPTTLSNVILRLFPLVPRI